MVSEEELAHRLFDAQNIHTAILTLSDDDVAFYDGSLRKNFFPDEGYSRVKAWISEKCLPGNIYLLEDFFHLSAVVVPLPDRNRNSENIRRYFVASPFTFEHLNHEDIENLLEDIGAVKGEINKELFDFYDSLPVVSSRERFQSYITALFPALYGEQYSEHMQMIYHYFAKRGTYLYSNEDSEEIDENYVSLVERRYEIENALLDCVRRGNEQEAIALHKKIGQLGLKARTSNALRNTKNFTIILNTLLRKSTEQCGVHTFYIDEVSRTFAIKIEQCTSQVQLFELAVEMIKSYCTQVREHKTGSYSEPIQRCITYIDFHCMEHFSLQELADEVFLNPSYLSAQFTKETGNTITNYINQSRVNHSLPLLAKTTRTIRDIANTCGFDDMNYFARVFKKITGVSPTEYRSAHRQ